MFGFWLIESCLKSVFGAADSDGQANINQESQQKAKEQPDYWNEQ